MNPPRSSTATLIVALRGIAEEIQPPDDAARACIAEAADRIEELDLTQASSEIERSLTKLRLLVVLWAGRKNENSLQCAKELTRVILPALNNRQIEEIEKALLKP